MGRSLKVMGVCALFLLAVTPPASANSSYSFSTKLVGNSSSSVKGSCTYDATKHTFSNISVTFNGGVFNGVNVNIGNGQGIYVSGKGYQGYLFSFLKKVNGSWVGVAFLFNTATNQFSEWGGISKGHKYGNFDYSVPEGGAELSYLILSGIVVFGGILLSSKQRRATRPYQAR